MSKRTTKKATVGEKIVDEYRKTFVTTHEESAARHARIARRIDSALDRERKRGDRRVLAERERCAKIADDFSSPNAASAIRAGK